MNPAWAMEGRRLQARAGARDILRQVEVQIPAGAWTCIVGPNGAGKTTLLRALAGLPAEAVVQGDIFLQGRPLHDWPLRERARHLAWLGQNEAVSAHLSCESIVLLGRLPHQRWLAGPSARDHDIVTQCMQQVQVEHLRHQSFQSLSGGERQRVLLARALAVQAQVVLMDEPLAHLDPPHQADWLEQVQALVAQQNTVVSVLHELSLALQADWLVIMAQGRVVHQGPPDEAATHKALESVFAHRIRLACVEGQWVVLPVISNKAKPMHPNLPACAAKPPEAMLVEPSQQAQSEGENASMKASIHPAEPQAANPSGQPLLRSAQPFPPEQRDAVYQAIFERRDMRHFAGGTVDEAVLLRLLRAAHHAPSVGFMQPWRFVRVQDGALRRSIHGLVEAERLRTAEALGERSDDFMRLKVQGVLDAAEVLVVALPPGRERHVFGRRTLPEMDVASTACAIQNLWLAARAEGLGMGWVSIFDPDALAQLLGMPEGARPLAVLCLGPVDGYYTEPMLQQEKWAFRAPLEDLIMQDRWQQNAEGHNGDTPST